MLEPRDLSELTPPPLYKAANLQQVNALVPAQYRPTPLQKQQREPKTPNMLAQPCPLYRITVKEITNRLNK